MVVVMLIAILAMLAVPTMSVARNDRIAFDYARQTTEIIHHARARAAGTGSAHLVLFTTDGSYGPRGAVFSFEALDGSLPPAGPSPASSCRLNAQWNWAAGYVPGAAPDTLYRSKIVDFLNINAGSPAAVQTTEDITMEAFTNVAGVLAGPITSIMLCMTPNGTTWFGSGSSPSDALNGVNGLLSQTQPFKGTVEIQVVRHRAGAPVGIKRRVVISGAGAPRIRSEGT